MRDYPSYPQTHFKVKEQLVVRKDIDVNEHERLSGDTQTHTKIKEQLVVRKVMHVREHERLSNFALRHKLQYRNSVFIVVLTPVVVKSTTMSIAHTLLVKLKSSLYAVDTMTWLTVTEYLCHQMTTDTFHLSLPLPSPFLIHDLSP